MYFLQRRAFMSTLVKNSGNIGLVLRKCTSLVRLAKTGACKNRWRQLESQDFSSTSFYWRLLCICVIIYIDTYIYLCIWGARLFYCQFSLAAYIYINAWRRRPGVHASIQTVVAYTLEWSAPTVHEFAFMFWLDPTSCKHSCTIHQVVECNDLRSKMVAWEDFEPRGPPMHDGCC